MPRATKPNQTKPNHPPSSPSSFDFSSRPPSPRRLVSKIQRHRYSSSFEPRERRSARRDESLKGFRQVAGKSSSSGRRSEESGFRFCVVNARGELDSEEAPARKVACAFPLPPETRGNWVKPSRNRRNDSQLKRNQRRI